MFTGTLDTAPVTALLGLLSRKARSGSIQVFGPATGVVQVLDGDVAFASARTGDDLGSELVRAGFLTTDEWQAAVASADPARHVAGALKRSGIDPERLHAHVRRQTEEAIWELDRWEGDFVYESATTDPLAGAFRHPIPSLLVAVRRRDSAWQDLEQIVPSVELVVVTAPARIEDDDDVTLSRAHYRLLGTVDGTRTVAQLAADLGLGLFRTTELVAGLVGAGLVALRDRGSSPMPARERVLVSVGAEVDEPIRSNGHVALDERPSWSTNIDLDAPFEGPAATPAPAPPAPIPSGPTPSAPTPSGQTGLDFVSHRDAPARDLILRLLSAVKEEL